MRQVRSLVQRIVIAAGAVALLSAVLTATIGSSPGAAVAYTGRATTPIKHLVVILKENRSFDEYFGRFPGADGATRGTMSNGKVVDLGVTPEPMPNDIAHTPKDWAAAYDNGKMDGFDKERGAYSKDGKLLSYTQMREYEIPNYWRYAKSYVLGDHMFAPWKGGSFPNNLFSVAAQTGQYSSYTSHRWAWSSTPHSASHTGPLASWGCDTVSDAKETMINSSGVKSYMFPCFDIKGMPNILAKYGVSWKFYGAKGDVTFNHNGLDDLSPVRKNPALWSHVVSYSHFVSDAKAGNLPSISWVLGDHIEHPVTTACSGENETVKYLNAIMSGPEWSSTAVVIYWDEWGGFYDHVKPPQMDGVSFGFRVPLLVISPYDRTGSSADGGFISHTFYSHLSVLKFIEQNWNLPSLTPKDAAANSLSDVFDFSGSARRPKLMLSTRSCPKISAALERQYAVDPE